MADDVYVHYFDYGESFMGIYVLSKLVKSDSLCAAYFMSSMLNESCEGI